MRHLKSGEEILDCEGNVPAICREHRQMHEMFCDTDNVSFCVECFSRHKGHEISQLAEKACNVRFRIGNLRKKLASNQKLIQDKLTMVEECIETKETSERKLVEILRDNLHQFVDNFIEDMKQKFQRHDELNVARERITELISQSGESDTSLERLLHLSDGVLITEFPNVERDHIKVSQKQFDVNMFSVFLRSFHIDHDNIAATQRSGASIMLGAVKPPEFIKRKVKVCSERSVHVSPTNFAGVSNELFFHSQNRVFRVEHHNDGNATVYACTLFKNGELASQNPIVKNINIDKNIEKVCPVGSEFIFLLEDQTFLTFDVKETKNDQQPFWLYQNPIAPYLSDFKTSWAFWDEDLRKVKFESHPRLEIDCEIKPTASDVYSSPAKEVPNFSMVAFVDDQLNIWIVNLANQLTEIIYQTRHGYSKIDQLTLLGDELIIWTLSPKTATIMRREENTWKECDTFSWKSNSSVVSLNSCGFNFLQFSYGNMRTKGRSSGTRELFVNKKQHIQILPIENSNSDQ